ncbi:MAG: ACT domain-containing protein [Oscillospiraceae bacterium]|nr:ACT domain-containing protein [Oscillospiraceae bacterium]
MFKQITVFVENKPGRLAEVTGCLADAQINLHALSIADTSDFGILRLIVSEADKTMAILKEKGFMAQTTEVLAIAMSHRPGSLYKILCELELFDISIEYMYAFTSRIEDYDAIVIMRLENQKEAVNKLKDSKIAILGQELLEDLNRS